MKILQEGKILLGKKFKCNKCNCIFIASNKEYETYKQWYHTFYRTSCPCCGKKIIQQCENTENYYE